MCLLFFWLFNIIQGFNSLVFFSESVYTKYFTLSTQMNEFDQNIITISDNICKNISTMPNSERGLVSQNILGNLRNLVEAVT